MISQFEISACLDTAIPELKCSFDVSNRSNPYVVMRTDLEFTAQKAREHDYRVVKRCFDLVGKLHDKGNRIIQNAVENVYVYSLESVLYASGVEKKKVLAIIPITLYTLYINQLYRHGC